MTTRVTRPPKGELQERYCRIGESLSSVARYYNTSHPTVRKWLISYGIPLKTHKEASIQANQRNSIRKKPDRNVLQKDYLDLSIKEMESKYGVGQQTIYDWLSVYGIELQSHSKACLVGKEKQFRDMKPSREDVELAYAKYGLIQPCATKFGISYSYMKKTLHEYKITVINDRSRSTKEIELGEFCVFLRPDLTWDFNDRSVINPYELDIVCHDLKLAIEYCGMYWHSETWGNKSRSYHKKKLDMCNERGYRLITVFESDDFEKAKQLIRVVVGQSKRIYARNTSCAEISPQDAKLFHKKYHMHGSVGASVHYGIFEAGELLQVLSVGKSRFTKHQYEITRMSSSHMLVVGGSSKLFINFVRDHKPKSVITFADLRYGTGNVYSSCGFEYLRITSPNYWYFKKDNPDRVYSRVAFQKHKLPDLLDRFNPDISEYQNMIENGWGRIWDCGNSFWKFGV